MRACMGLLRLKIHLYGRTLCNSADKRRVVRLDECRCLTVRSSHYCPLFATQSSLGPTAA